MQERVPVAALVGRPNVGKSTLFNRLVGRRAAIVDATPGVTRDRNVGELRWEDRLLRVVDTGGFESDPGDSLLQRVREQTQLAIDEADLVVLVLDGQLGAHPDDREVLDLLRRAGKPVLAVANKMDLPEHEVGLADLYALGVELMPVSAEHGRGMGELCDALCERLQAPKVPEEEDDPEEAAPEEAGDADDESPAGTHIEWDRGVLRVAVVGRPNVGKSSLINRLLGEERLLASETPGTTRDSIDTEYEYQGQRYVFVDTAGVRRKRSIADRIERYAVLSALRSIERADVVVLVLDASEAPAEQDAKIAALVIERGRGLLVAANKWDQVDNEEAAQGFAEGLSLRLGFVGFAPLHRVSAKSGRGVQALLPALVEVQVERHRRVGTGELNRFFHDVVEAHPPPTSGKARPRLFFVSQPHVAPPTFVFAASHPKGLAPSYVRYLERALRERYGFAGTPLWVKLRGRRQSGPRRAGR